MTRIAILQHPEQEYPRHYFIAALANYWQEKGLHVEPTADPTQAATADVVINHIDRTKIKAEQLAPLVDHPCVLNRHVLDISKRHVSRHLIHHPDETNQPVIVKTDNNARGRRERRQARENGSTLAYRLRKHLTPWYKSGIFGSKGYRIFNSPTEVPRPVWDNPLLVVERFHPEIRDGNYVIRTYVFFGDRHLHFESYGTEPIIKRHNNIGMATLGDIPEEILQFRKELGFDYGKFDYVVPENRAILLDANRTPSADLAKARIKEYGQLLGEGLNSFLGEKS